MFLSCSCFKSYCAPLCYRGRLLQQPVGAWTDCNFLNYPFGNDLIVNGYFRGEDLLLVQVPMIDQCIITCMLTLSNQREGEIAIYSACHGSRQAGYAGVPG